MDKFYISPETQAIVIQYFIKHGKAMRKYNDDILKKAKELGLTTPDIREGNVKD
ncbi:hypothetical protein LCGC14_0864610 [marine sediment metagenome]|uniref:Uncharacterized protein n=1 Tax=marine sediment metagenome TaxID=412755 RepID=A0A0F9RR25_9ZZZZ